MAQMLLAGAAGFLFAIGLIVSQMVNPAKVLGFLDLAGHWDPTLAFVMGGALIVAMPGFRLARRRTRPWLTSGFYLPTRREIDARLVIGAAIFGVGWGLAGFCPGPAITGLTSGLAPVAGFVAAMAAGMLIARFLERRLPPSRVPGYTQKSAASNAS